MAMKNLDDSILLSDYINGNEKAFEVLVLRHKDKIYRYIYLKVKNQLLAEDIFQETFIKAIRTIKLGAYNEDGKFLPWIMRIAHNLAIDHFRKTNKIKLISETSSKNEDFNIFNTLQLNELNIQDQISLDELKTQMVDLVEYLPDSQKDIIKMRIFQDLSFKEIADLENISINTALGRMRYALINLRKLIEKHQLVTDI
ncbi:MAG TPA: sigma-70 family RNA polymerase sigma factor [Taishania sp.]|nr:sigma-70 family RNA polymerase sigma factor [Taishania sp.]HNS43425.1 sigma-70 family RNA polymerase sigma factor [Taishania sp.]